MAIMNRSGEQGGVPHRNARIIVKENYWYYTTREGVDIGPFDSYKNAEIAAIGLIDFIHETAPKPIEANKSYRAA